MRHFSFIEDKSTKLLQLIVHPFSFIARPSMFAVRAKIYRVLYNQANSIAFDETSSYWSVLKRF